MNKTFLIFSVIGLLIVILDGCHKEEPFPIINLEAKPENINPYFNLVIDGVEYRLLEDSLNYTTSLGYSFPAKDSKSTPAFYSNVYNDSSIFEYQIGFRHNFLSKNELIFQLSQQNQPLAFGIIQEYNDGKWIYYYDIKTYGFEFVLTELESAGGPGSGYSSMPVDQPESSFVTIHHIYYVEGSHMGSIWLQGEFNLRVQSKYSGQDFKGEFFLEFPLCCFE